MLLANDMCCVYQAAEPAGPPAGVRSSGSLTAYLGHGAAGERFGRVSAKSLGTGFRQGQVNGKR